MRAGQTLRDNNNYQVALFPMQSFVISQGDTETVSHDPSRYWATDYLGYNLAGSRVYRCPCYAPVDIKCVWTNRTECCAIWESLQPVHMVGDRIDYLTMIVYHDNDIANGTIVAGTIKRQGQEFNQTGTGGNVSGDHMHLETGYGKFTTPANHFHIENSGGVHRLHNYDCLYINDTVPRHTSYYPTEYPWVTFTGGSPYPIPNYRRYKFKWVLYANKIRNR